MNPIIAPTTTVLLTKRLSLRYPKSSDAGQIFSAVQSPQFPELLPLKEMSSENQVATWLGRLQEFWAEARVFSWIAEDLGSGKLVGQITLSKKEGKGLWALAFWTHPVHWGKGYASEGAARLLKFGFEMVGAETIWAGAGEWNKGSCRVLEKIGMEYLGINPIGYFSKGKPIITREYQISKTRWQELN